MQKRKLGNGNLEVSANQALVDLLTAIPGTTKLHRLEENLGAANVELTSDDLREIESAAAHISVQGARYSEGGQKMIDR